MSVLTKWATGRNIIILLLIFLIINLVVISAFYPKFPTRDTLSSYMPEQAHQYLTSYGEQGRQLYLIIELTLDLVYPFATALLFSLAILYSFQRGFPNQRWTHKLALLPFLVLLADYIENTCVVIMLLSFPTPLPLVAQVSNVSTITKFALTPLELLLIVGLIGWLVRFLSHRRPLSPAS